MSRARRPDGARRADVGTSARSFCRATTDGGRSRSAGELTMPIAAADDGVSAGGCGLLVIDHGGRRFTYLPRRGARLRPIAVLDLLKLPSRTFVLQMKYAAATSRASGGGR